MSILTIVGDTLEADFEKLLERWSNDDEIVGVTNLINACPVAVLFKEENPSIERVMVREHLFAIPIEEGGWEHFYVSEKLGKFICDIDDLANRESPHDTVHAKEARAIIEQILSEAE